MCEYKVGDIVQTISLDGKSVIIFSLDSIFHKTINKIWYRVTVLYSEIEISKNALFADSDFLKESRVTLAPINWQILYGKTTT